MKRTMTEPITNRGVRDLREMRYSSLELDRLVSMLKDEPREAVTLVILGGGSSEQNTITAEAIAKELPTNLVRVDLRRVVSKYLGETEKNLDRVFADASSAGATLLFDEADALFGRRTEVQPAGDPYDSVEMSSLLQHVDAYSGIVLMIVNDASPVREWAGKLRRASTVVILDR
jgi:ATP-dependent 26S proteasome regulatory subunit